MRATVQSEVDLMPILNISDDPVLLETRTAILERAGYNTVPVASVAAALGLLGNNRFELVVVGQSLPPEERDLLIREVRRAGKGAVLVISQAYEKGVVPPDFVISPLEGPRGLLEAVHKMLLEEEGAAAT